MRQKSFVCLETLPRRSNIIPAMPLRNLPKIFFLPSFLKLFLIRAQQQNIYFFLFIVCLFVCAIDTSVNKGEPIEEFAEPEPEEPYREQELPEGFEDGKFNLILWLHISTQFYKHNLLACFTKLHMLLLLKTWLDSHLLICYNHFLTT